MATFTSGAFVRFADGTRRGPVFTVINDSDLHLTSNTISENGFAQLNSSFHTADSTDSHTVVIGMADITHLNAARFPAEVPSFAASASFGLPNFTVKR